jgi:hypothetical protein
LDDGQNEFVPQALETSTPIEAKQCSPGFTPLAARPQKNGALRQLQVQA